MWLDRLLSGPTIQSLEVTARFAELRQRVLAENLANVDTPGYQFKSLDTARFQSALHDALQASRSSPRPQALNLRGGTEVRSRAGGGLDITPSTEPADNVLFHDGTNTRVERLMAEINANALSYELATSLLRGKFETLLRAVRGRVT